MTHGMVRVYDVKYFHVLAFNLLCTFIIGTKNVAKEMKKICQGKVRDRGKTWFPQLVDKRKEMC